MQFNSGVSRIIRAAVFASRRGAYVSLVAGAAVASAPPAALASVPSLHLAGSFNKPVGPFDLLPDGRMVVLSGSDVLVQASAFSSTFSVAGRVAPGFISSFGAAFISVSPDGSRAAIGNGEFGAGARLGMLDLNSLSPAASTTPMSTPMNAFSGVWLSGSELLVAGAETTGSAVSSVNADSLARRVVVSNIGGSIGGVTVSGGWLFASNGFDFDPTSGSNTGEIRAAVLADVLGSPTAIDFENSMTPVARVLSASYLDVDSAGNMYAGGGDLFGGSGDFGYAAVIDRAEIDLVLAGGAGTGVGGLAGVALAVLPPGVPLSASTALRHNAATGEALFSFFDNDTFTEGPTVFRYAIPGPASWLVVAGGFFVSARRRRHA